MIKYWRILLVTFCLSAGYGSYVNAQVTVSLDPVADATLFYDPNNYGAQYTNYGTYSLFKAEKYYTTCRSVIKFDLSSIPSTATIQSADLYLYNPGSPNAHVLSGSQSSLNRITQNWTETSAVWYYFQYTTTGSINVPAATSTYQDYQVDISSMVQSWVNNTFTNNGLLLKLNNETSGGALKFGSREYTNASKRPKLVITYTNDYKTQYTEGFEFASTKWNNTTGDNMNWGQGIRRSVNELTGPAKATDGIYYCYLESNNNLNKSGHLLSPKYDLSKAGKAVLSFDYHMYGASMGSLALNISKDGGVTWSNLWNLTGNQGDNWFNKKIVLDNTYVGQPSILLRFTGITGSINTSDMAIDNISLSTNKIITPTANQNYISTTTPQSELGMGGPIQQSIQYYDGLGRLDQEVNAFASPMGFDLIKPVVYDEFGRITKDFLPYPDANATSSHGSLRDADWENDPSNPQAAFYQAHFNLGSANPYAYSRTVFEDSPLNRVLEQGAPGAAFQPIEENPGLAVEHDLRMDYQTNSNSDCVFQLTVTSNGDLSNSSGYFISGPNFYIYAQNELYKTITKNENWVTANGLRNTIEEFKDKQGRVILKRTYGSNLEKLDTYYVYDDFGLLRYVIPPEGATKFGTVWSCSKDDSKIKLWCYYYQYDDRNRMISKRLPGTEQVYMVYDNRDRLVLTQDGNQRLTNKWAFTKYDPLNRPIMTGIYTHSSSLTQSGMQDFLKQKLTDPSYKLFEEPSSNTSTFYTDNSFPKSSDGNGYQPYILTFYDNYNFRSTVTGFTALSFNQTRKIDTYLDNDGTNNGYFDYVKGLATGSKTLVLDGVTPNNWILSVNYYDNRYQLIQSQSTLYTVGTSMISTKCDFVGKVLESIEIQNVNAIENSLRTRMEYDHMGRLVNTFQYFNEQSPVLLAQNKYNELGELKEKNLHSKNLSSFLQSVDYSYNIRGWLTQINNPDNLGIDNDYFGMKLLYETPDPSFMAATAQFNGNISQIEWKHNNGTTLKGYNYSYDVLNRLLSANHKNKVFAVWNDITNFDVEGITYDLNGNIKTLKRKNSTGIQIDNLTYDYTGTGNKLNSVSDAGNTDGFNNRNVSGSDYEYDNNGNMKLDKNKTLRISYNYLNLPERVYPETTGSDEIKFVYDASGVKWQKVSKNTGVTTTTSYNHSFVYNGASGSQVLDYALTPEGMVKKSTTAQYHYFIKDHLGNTRVTVYDADADGALDLNTAEVLQTVDYYPFGMQFDGGVGGNNKYLYNGKEIQLDKIGTVGLDWYDYGARMYDAQLGRWHSVDPLAEEAPDWTVYRYGFNNPIIFTDPGGMFETKYEDEAGRLLLETNDGSDAVVTVTDDKKDAFNWAVAHTSDFNNPEWNNAWKSNLLGFELSGKQESLLSSMNSDWSRKSAIKYWQTGDISAGVGFAFKEALSQWTNPELVITGLMVGVAGYPTSSTVKSSSSLAASYPSIPEITGTAERTFLSPGKVIDRFGGSKGYWFSEPGVSYGARSIPPDIGPYTQFRVLKPFEVNQSLAAPGAFSSQTGFGIQYQSNVTVNILLKRNIITPIE